MVEIEFVFALSARLNTMALIYLFCKIALLCYLTQLQIQDLVSHKQIAIASLDTSLLSQMSIDGNHFPSGRPSRY